MGNDCVDCLSDPHVQLPEDEGCHPGMLTEWWYGNFALNGSDGRQYGGMVAYFNAGLRIQSICDLEAKRLYPEVSISSPTYAEGVLDLRWGSEDRWFRIDRQSLSYRLDSYGAEGGLHLGLTSLKPPLLVGGNGLIEWPFGSSYYYSLTRLQAGGQIEIGGKRIDIEGIGWMDHQWMNFLPAAVDRSYSWFSVQLDNHTEMVFWQVVTPDESIESRDATIMLSDNAVYHSRNFSLRSVESWLSPVTGREYGILWRVREETHDLDLAIKARCPEQEIGMTEALGFDHAIWEGRTAVSGRLAGGTVYGTGYAELIRPPKG